jgi:hypothetical protein
LVTLILWIFLLIIGIFINKLFLANNQFSKWENSFLAFPFIFSFLLAVNAKYFNALKYWYIVICVLSALFGIFNKNGYDQNSFDVVEYCSNCLFPHNESILFGIRSVPVNINQKWLIFISFLIIIISSSILITLIKYLAERIYYRIQIAL